MTTSSTDRLAAELAPSPDAIARIHDRMLELADEPVVTRDPSPPRGVRRRLRIGVAVAGAAAIALAIALSPFEGETSHQGVLGPSPTLAAAQAAFRHAAVAAGVDDAGWTPLAPGEYHHTMSTSFTPHIHGAARPKYPAGHEPPPAASSSEAFLDPGGHGIRIDVDGGNGDPDSYLTLHPPTGTANGTGYSYPLDHYDTVGSVADRLRYADLVRTTSWPRAGGPPASRTWYRTRRGFEVGDSFPGAGIPRAGLSDGQRFQRDRWGAPFDVLERLNSAQPSELGPLLDPVLSEVPDGEMSIIGPLAQGDYDETRAWFAAQVEVLQAVRLLGNAPIAPRVRQALFQRLADQAHARLERNVRDEAGRPGTRVTFEWTLDEQVPAFHVTLADLRDDARAHDQPWQAGVDDPGRLRVPSHRSVGHWYQSIVFDEATGEILQDELASDWKTTKPVPRLGPAPGSGGASSLAVRWEPGTYGGGDGTLFNVRERTRAITHLQTTACATTPRMCR